MINFSLNIRNPWSRIKFCNFKCWAWITPFAYKSCEFEIYRDPSWFSMELRITAKQSHAGIDCELGMFGYCAHFAFYDTRHWDTVTDTWQSSVDDK